MAAKDPTEEPGHAITGHAGAEDTDQVGRESREAGLLAEKGPSDDAEEIRKGRDDPAKGEGANENLEGMAELGGEGVQLAGWRWQGETGQWI